LVQTSPGILPGSTPKIIPCKSGKYYSKRTFGAAKIEECNEISCKVRAKVCERLEKAGTMGMEESTGRYGAAIPDPSSYHKAPATTIAFLMPYLQIVVFSS